MEEELLYRNQNRRTDRWTDRQTDRQTAMVKPVYLQNFVGGVYKLIFNVEKSLQMTPLRSNFRGAVTFSRPVVQNLNRVSF